MKMCIFNRMEQLSVFPRRKARFWYVIVAVLVPSWVVCHVTLMLWYWGETIIL